MLDWEPILCSVPKIECSASAHSKSVPWLNSRDHLNFEHHLQSDLPH